MEACNTKSSRLSEAGCPNGAAQGAAVSCTVPAFADRIPFVMATGPLSDGELDRLAAFGTILFGRKSGCDESAAMRAMLRVPAEGGASTTTDGTVREDGPFFIACDGSDEEQTVCKQAGVSQGRPASSAPCRTCVSGVVQLPPRLC